LDSFGVLDKVIAYLKDEGSDLNILIFALTYIVSYFALQLACQFVKSCFGHAMSKVTQYTIDNSKVYVHFSEDSLKQT
jgi:hypothetical protein